MKKYLVLLLIPLLLTALVACSEKTPSVIPSSPTSGQNTTQPTSDATQPEDTTGDTAEEQFFFQYEGVKLIPGADCRVAEYLLEHNDALVIESFGVGGLPTYKAGDYYDAAKAGLDAGKTVVMTTQVENEGSDLSVYHVGGYIKRNMPILEAYDMTTEAVTAKLMWILGQTTDQKKVAKMFYTPVACDILAAKH